MVIQQPNMKQSRYFIFPEDVERTDQRVTSRNKSCRHNASIISMFLCCLIAISTVALAVHFNSRPREERPWAEEITTWMERRTAQTFSLHDEYVSGSNSGVDDAWNALSPEGKGWVILDPQQNPFFMDMSKNDETLSRQGACLSVFHQLHCLNKIRQVTSWLSTNRGDLPAGFADQASHMGHCFDYLRQSIMCAADVTPEWVRPGENMTTGWGYIHQCRNFEELKRWAEKNRVNGLPANLD